MVKGVMKKGWRLGLLEGDRGNEGKVTIWLTLKWKEHWRKVKDWYYWRVKVAMGKEWRFVLLKRWKDQWRKDDNWAYWMVKQAMEKGCRFGLLQKVKGALKKGWRLGSLEGERGNDERGVKILVTKKVKGPLKKGWGMGLLEGERGNGERVNILFTKRWRSIGEKLGLTGGWKEQCRKGEYLVY